MKSYYRPDFDPQQAGYRRTRRLRLALRGARRLALAASAAGMAALVAWGWQVLGPGWLRDRLAERGVFRLEHVEVAGNGAVADEELVAAAGLRRGESLLGVDLDVVRGRLAAHPWVREAALRRVLPGTLRIDVRERVPCAVVRDGVDWLVDAEGAVVAPAAPGEAAGFPVLVGARVDGGRLDARGAEAVAAGLELVAAIRAVGFPALEAVAHIDLADPEDAVIVPLGGRPIVHAGRGDALARLRRWERVAQDMAARWPEIEYVDLRAEGQVVALPAAPAEAAPEGAGPAKRDRGGARAAPGGRPGATEGSDA